MGRIEIYTTFLRKCARPLRRAIQRDIEDALSEKILFGEIECGQKVIVDAVGEGLLGEFTFRGELWDPRIGSDPLSAEVAARQDAERVVAAVGGPAVGGRDGGPGAAKELLAERGFDPVLGTRPLRRAIQRDIEDALSEKILFGEIQRGQRIVVDAEGEGVLGEFTFHGEPWDPRVGSDPLSAEVAAQQDAERVVAAVGGPAVGGRDGGPGAAAQAV